MTREVALDTETTGFDPFNGDRIIEIGAVELIDHMPTGRTCQLYINPEREVPAEAIAIHGITNEFLKDKPTFIECYSEFMDFIADDSKLIIHNAEFDMKFLNWELENIGHKPINWDRVIDTLTMARKKFPGSPANLDALCRRFKIDNTARTYHGALLDSELLAEVYLELLGGRQRGLELVSDIPKQQDLKTNDDKIILSKNKKIRKPRPHTPNKAEIMAHERLLNKINNPLWKEIMK